MITDCTAIPHDISLTACSKTSDEILNECACILVDFWGGSIASRKSAMLEKIGSFVLTTKYPNRKECAIGFARIAYSSGSTDSVGACLCGIVTSVIVADVYRGKGYGASLMKLIEMEAIKLGYCFLYLWTSDAVDFYRKLGFSECPRLTESVSAFRSVGSSSISKLENLMALRFAKSNDETVLPPHSNTSTVYMKKRIRDELPLEAIGIEDFCKVGLSQVFNSLEYGAPTGPIDLFVRSVPWSRQVGPSCGIQAIRMVLAALSHFPQELDLRSVTGPRRSSLLQRAIDAGCSAEGELFDIDAIARLAISEGLCAVVQNVDDLGWEGIVSVLDPGHTNGETQGGLLIFPYDRGKTGGLPEPLGGRHAHHGVVCGYALAPAASSVSVAPSSTSNSLGQKERVVTCRIAAKSPQSPENGNTYIEQTFRRKLSDDERKSTCEEHMHVSLEKEWPMLIVMQGMHSHPVIAPYKKWRDSNAQLGSSHENVRREWEEKGWKVPPEGPNLSGKCVVITCCRHETTPG